MDTGRHQEQSAVESFTSGQEVGEAEQLAGDDADDQAEFAALDIDLTDNSQLTHDFGRLLDRRANDGEVTSLLHHARGVGTGMVLDCADLYDLAVVLPENFNVGNGSDLLRNARAGSLHWALCGSCSSGCVRTNGLRCGHAAVGRLGNRTFREQNFRSKRGRNSCGHGRQMVPPDRKGRLRSIALRH